VIPFYERKEGEGIARKSSKEKSQGGVEI